MSSRFVINAAFVAGAILGLSASPAAAQTEPTLLADSRSWPTLHGDLQRSGFYPSFPNGPLRLVWRKELWRELTGPRAEVIVGEGLAFVGTYAGNLYAWDVTTGDQRWLLPTGGPIGHSPAFHQGTVFFGSMDGKLRAVEARTGRLRWAYGGGAGIWVAPAVHAGRVMYGDRRGVLRALDTTMGRVLWDYKTGAPILSSASVSPDGERVVCASEDMHVYCLRTEDGAVLWTSRKLAGLTLRDYAPVVVGGLVLVTTSPVKDFHTILDEHQAMLIRRAGFSGKDPRYAPGAEPEVRAEQEFIVDFLRAHPEEQTFYALRLADGTEPWVAPVLYTGGLHNPMSPPCFNPVTGEVFTQVRSAYTTWDGGGEVRPFTGFGKLDLTTGRVALLGHGYHSKDPSRPAGDRDKPWGCFNYIGDETQALACAAGRLFCTHQGNLGEMDLATGFISNLFGKRDSYGGFYGGANFGWENQGGPERAKARGQPYALVNEWHGPARAIVSVAGRRVFFPVGSQVLCLEERTGAQPAGGAR